MRRHPLDPVRVPFAGTLVVPKPVLAPVRHHDKRRLHVLGVAAGLLLRLIRIGVLPLRLQHAKRSVRPKKHVIGATSRGIEFEPDLPRVKQIPAALRERLIYENSGKRFWFVHDMFNGTSNMLPRPDK